MTAADRNLHYRALLWAVTYVLSFCMGVTFTVVVQAVLS